jgi:hypothetical protein
VLVIVFWTVIVTIVTVVKTVSSSPSSSPAASSVFHKMYYALSTFLARSDPALLLPVTCVHGACESDKRLGQKVTTEPERTYVLYLV